MYVVNSFESWEEIEFFGGIFLGQIWGRMLTPCQLKNEQKLPKKVHYIPNSLAFHFGEQIHEHRKLQMFRFTSWCKPPWVNIAVNATGYCFHYLLVWHLDINIKNQRKIVNIFLPINFNICFGCSKEPSHWDGSFEYPQHMFWLRNKKILLAPLTEGLNNLSFFLYKVQFSRFWLFDHFFPKFPDFKSVG